MEERLAGGKLILDGPPRRSPGSRISNPERRNALDHEILDALAEALPRLDRGIETRCVLITGAPPVFSAGYDIGSIPAETFERDAEALVAHPFHAAMEAIAKHPWPTVAAINGHCLGGGLELAITCDLRICADRGEAGDAAGEARPDLRPHRPAQVPRRGRAGADQGAVPDRAQLRGAAGRADRPRQRGGRRRAARGRRRSSSPPRSPPTRRSRCGATSSAIDLLNACPVLTEQQEAGLVALRESCFASEDFREGIRAFAEKRRAELDGPVSAKARDALAASDPTMAALIERLGEIDLATRLRRRSEERPADAYGALLRAIVGQQLSTKAARTIYVRVLDLFDGSTPSPEQLLEASEADLRGAGLSGRKVEYVRDLASHVISGELELDRLDELSDEEVIEEIVAVRGLGRWTAEMFLIFHLERPDVLSGGDLGIRKAMQIEYGLEEMPTPAAGAGDRRALAPAPQPRLALPLGVAGGRARRLSEPRRTRPRISTGSGAGRQASMRLRFWRRPRRGAADRCRLDRRGPGRPRRRHAPTSIGASETRRCGRRTRPRRWPSLSVGQLASAAAFFQAEGDLQPARVRRRRRARCCSRGR